jgi:hypothetical protein
MFFLRFNLANLPADSKDDYCSFIISKTKWTSRLKLYNLETWSLINLDEKRNLSFRRSSSRSMEAKANFLSQFARQCRRTILFGEIEKADLNGKSNNASHDASLVCGADKAKA